MADAPVVGVLGVRLAWDHLFDRSMVELVIKLLVPDMPSADELLPYLRKIDATHSYVNNGPLVQHLERRLQTIHDAPCVALSNGTVALQLALAEMIQDFSVTAVGMPALTFCATGLAASAQNLWVSLFDVEADSWKMSSRIDPFEKGLTAVVPVATFGSPVYVKQWESFPVPVVIDAAGAFMTQRVSRDKNIATCFSLHATKFIGCGEGGVVACANQEVVDNIRKRAMFGFYGTNAKMSEYHAAVALASLDRMEEKLERTAQRRDWYIDSGISEFEHSYLGDSSTLLNVLLPEHVTADGAIKIMAEAGIETKQWYRPFLDERREFAAVRDPLPVTDHLRKHLLGIPFHNFLTKADVRKVCDTLGEIVA